MRNGVSNTTCRVAGAVLALGLVTLMSAPAAAQSSSPDSSAASKADSTRPAKTTGTTGDELVLGEIRIDAIVEKPNVDIIPKRREPNLDEFSFLDRSFDREIKALPADMPNLDPDLDAPKKVESLDKKAGRKKKQKQQKKKKPENK